jgi:MOSC domain-containing protein YiiM
MPSIYSIVYKPKERLSEERMDFYVRSPLQHASLVVDYGIQGDQKGGHHPDRQLNILSREWLLAQKEKGFKIEPGQFGEQIVISGLVVETLEPGSRLQIGGEARVEVVKARTGCEHFEAVQGRSREGLGAMGVMARVIASGEIRVGDPVTVLETINQPGD